jgi:hypothetical protein
VLAGAVTFNVALADAPAAMVRVGVENPPDHPPGRLLASAKVLLEQAALSRLLTVTVYERVAGSVAPAPWLDGLIVVVGACATHVVDTWKVALSAVRLSCWIEMPEATSLNAWPSPSAVMNRVLPLPL